MTTMQCLDIDTFAVYANTKAISSSNLEIPRIPIDNPPTYNDFFVQFMRPNRPVILTGLACDWECFRHWSSPDRTSVDFGYLRDRFQSLEQDVPVADCRRFKYNSHEKLNMSFEHFILYWEDQVDNPGKDTRLLYLKDWHLRKLKPEYKFYETPSYFGSDWLNEYLLDANADDYMFVYMGPKGTWTPFHSDVFGSFSWSTNIIGTKRWIFLPPGEEKKLADRFGNLPFTVEPSELEAKNVNHVIVDQKAGETVFVPSGWYHQVSNEHDTISVNHNWFNGCNVDEIWKVLKEMLTKVRKEIDDCRDMEDFDGHCQTMLRAGHGMNYKDFFTLLDHVAKRRIFKKENDGTVVANGFRLSREHVRFDLVTIKRVLKDLLQSEDECERLSKDLVDRCKTLFSDIEACLCE